MKKIVFSCLAFLLAGNALAADVIISKDAKRIDATVTELGVYVVKYKLAAEPNGPTFVIPKSEVASIAFESGRIMTFIDNHTVSNDSVISAPVAVKVDSTANVDSAFSVNPDDNYSYSQAAQVPEENDSHYGHRHYQQTPPDYAPENNQPQTDNFDVKPFTGFRVKVDAAALFASWKTYDCSNNDYYNSRSDSSKYVDPGMQASLSLGYQFNPSFYAGIGVNVASMDAFDLTSISPFAEVTFNCLHSRISPQVGIRLGEANQIQPDNQMGFFLEPSVGFSYRISPILSWGLLFGLHTEWFYMDTDNDNYYSDGYYRYYDSYDELGCTSLFLKAFFMF